MPDWSPDTWLIAAGRTRVAGDPLNVAPVFASNFYLPDDRLYSRTDGTPTTDALEALLGGLDGGRALVFGSGMAAAAVVFNGLPVGSHIAVPSDPYHGVAGLIAEGEAQGRWTVRRLDQADTPAWLDALQHCDLVWLESPENPLIFSAGPLIVVVYSQHRSRPGGRQHCRVSFLLQTHQRVHCEDVKKSS